jgi:hypothetical protein
VRVTLIPGEPLPADRREENGTTETTEVTEFEKKDRFQNRFGRLFSGLGVLCELCGSF